MHLFPWPFEIRPARMNDPHLRIAVPVALFRFQMLRDRIVQRSCLADALRPAEAGLHRALILIDSVKTQEQTAHDKPCRKSQKTTDYDFTGHEIVSPALISPGSIDRII